MTTVSANGGHSAGRPAAAQLCRDPGARRRIKAVVQLNRSLAFSQQRSRSERAGRFDRQVAIGNPDLIGRVQILKIHSRNIKLAPDFDLERAARVTAGSSGADLENAMNEAALLAAVEKRPPSHPMISN